MTIEATIEHYILTELLVGKRTKIDPDESLIGSGTLDSLTLLQLIAFLEEEYSFTVDDSEMTPDNFQTINEMKRFIETKTQDG